MGDNRFSCLFSLQKRSLHLNNWSLECEIPKVCFFMLKQSLICSYVFFMTITLTKHNNIWFMLSCVNVVHHIKTKYLPLLHIQTVWELVARNFHYSFHYPWGVILNRITKKLQKQYNSFNHSSTIEVEIYMK